MTAVIRWVSRGLSNNHQGEITVSLFHPFEDVVLTGGEDGTLRLWRIGRTRSLLNLRLHDRYVSSACFCAGGRFFASGAWDETLTIARVDTGALVRRLRLQSTACALAATPNGCISVGCAEGTVAVLGTSGRMCQRWNHKCHVTAVCVAHTSQRVFSGGEDGRVFVWEPGRKRPVRRFECPGPITALALSPDDGELLVAGEWGSIASGRGSTLRIQVSTGRHRGEISGSAPITAIAASPQWQELVFGQLDGRVCLANLSSASVPRCITVLPGAVNAVAIARRRRAILACDDSHGPATLWDEAGRELQRFAEHEGSVLCVAAQARKHAYVTGGSDFTARLHDLDQRRAPRVIIGASGAVDSIVWPPREDILYCGDMEGLIYAYDCCTGRLRWSWSGGVCEWRTLACAQGLVAALDCDGRLSIICQATGRTLRVCEPAWLDLTIRDVAFRPGHPALLLATSRGLYELALARRRLGAAQPIAQNRGLDALAVSTTGTCFMFSRNDRAVRAWNWREDGCGAQVMGRMKGAERLRLSPDERTLLAVSPDEVRLWDTRSYRLLQRIRQGGISDAAFTGDSRQILTVGSASMNAVCLHEWAGTDGSAGAGSSGHSRDVARTAIRCRSARE